MLPLLALKKFLSDSDPWVRDAAAQPFIDGCSQDPDIAKILLANVERWGEDAHPLLLRDLDRLAFDEGALAQLLALQGPDRPLLAEALECVVLSLPPNEAAALAERTPVLAPAVVDLIQLKLKYTGRPAKDNWKDLLQRCKVLSRDAGSADDEEALLAELDAMVVTVADQTYPSGDELCRKVHRGDLQDFELLRSALCILGRRREPAAVPVLAALLPELGWEDDALTMAAYDALARIAHPDTARLLYEQRPSAEADRSAWHLAVSEVAERIYAPESLAVLLQILGEEPELDVKTGIMSALLSMCDASAFRLVLAAARRGDYDPQWAELRHDLLPFATIHGVELPEAAAWAEERRDEDERIRRQLESLGDD